jgi:hypothetical protein
MTDKTCLAAAAAAVETRDKLTANEDDRKKAGTSELQAASGKWPSLRRI